MKSTFLIIALIANAAAAFAGTVTIVSDSGPWSGGEQFGLWVGETWTQSGSYSGVTIAADLAGTGGVSPHVGTGTAYLMEQLGPGTTAANEVAAPFDVTAPPPSITMTTLFSGLTLGPGTYYLLVDETNPGDLAWLSANSPSFTLDSGVTDVSSFGISGSVASFSPASSFKLINTDYIFSVTATGVPTTATPEPRILGIVGVVFVGMVLVTRRCLRSSTN